MKIGLDAKWFFSGPPSGRNVIRNLIEQIVKQNTDHDLYIFLDSRSRHEVFPFISDRVHCRYVWGRNNLLSNIFVLPWMAKFLRLDVLVFQNFTPPISNFKTIAFVHDLIFLTHPQYFTLKERIYLYPIKWLGRTADKICTVSEAEKNRIIAQGVATKDKVDVIYNGVSSHFKPRECFMPRLLEEVKERYHIPDSFLLYVGRLNERKNIQNLLNAITFLNTDIPLVIVGSYDWKMFDIKRFLEKLGLEDRVILTGYIEDEHLPIIYSLATVFCFVSYEEGFGLPALESMASGVPVVVSNRSSLPEVCGEAGNYVDPDDPRNIAMMVDKLLSEESYYEQQQIKGLQRAEEFCWEKSAMSLLKCITNLCKRW